MQVFALILLYIITSPQKDFAGRAYNSRESVPIHPGAMPVLHLNPPMEMRKPSSPVVIFENAEASEVESGNGSLGGKCSKE